MAATEETAVTTFYIGQQEHEYVLLNSAISAASKRWLRECRRNDFFLHLPHLDPLTFEKVIWYLYRERTEDWSFEDAVCAGALAVAFQVQGLWSKCLEIFVDSLGSGLLKHTQDMVAVIARRSSLYPSNIRGSLAVLCGSRASGSFDDLPPVDDPSCRWPKVKTEETVLLDLLGACILTCRKESMFLVMLKRLLVRYLHQFQRAVDTNFGSPLAHPSHRNGQRQERLARMLVQKTPRKRRVSSEAQEHSAASASTQ